MSRFVVVSRETGRLQRQSAVMMTYICTSRRDRCKRQLLTPFRLRRVHTWSATARRDALFSTKFTPDVKTWAVITRFEKSFLQLTFAGHWRYVDSAIQRPCSIISPYLWFIFLWCYLCNSSNRVTCMLLLSSSVFLRIFCVHYYTFTARNTTHGAVRSLVLRYVTCGVNVALFTAQRDAHAAFIRLAMTSSSVGPKNEVTYSVTSSPTWQ